MATRIRLRRIGRKKVPIYRIVVADKEKSRDGRFIVILGTYDPRAEDSKQILVAVTFSILCLAIAESGLRFMNSS